MDQRTSHRALTPRTSHANLPAPVPAAAESLRPKPHLTRRYETQYIKPNGDIGYMTRVAPAQPVYESTCAAIARGTLIDTEFGPMAIEDIEPGINIKTETGGMQTLLWRGQTLLIHGVPNQSPEMGTTIRISSDRFGFDRPSRPLMLGPKARVVMSNGENGLGLRGIRELIDGENVVSINPPTPIEVFHIAFEQQQIVAASGVLIESYHPGRKLEKMISREALATLMGMFPHLQSIEEFGAQVYPRIDRREHINAM